jgi:hypothetical protein
VYLNVYKLDSFEPYEMYLKYLFLGAYHSGIQVHGEEISYALVELEQSFALLRTFISVLDFIH